MRALLATLAVLTFSKLCGPLPCLNAQDLANDWSRPNLKVLTADREIGADEQRLLLSYSS